MSSIKQAGAEVGTPYSHREIFFQRNHWEKHLGIRPQEDCIKLIGKPSAGGERNDQEA